jgi:hypothetical protein
MKAIRITILSACDDGSETKVDELTLIPNHRGEFAVQDYSFTAHGDVFFLGATIVDNGNMHLRLAATPFAGLSDHVYAQAIVDCMMRFGGPPTQVIARTKPQCLVRIFAEGVK